MNKESFIVYNAIRTPDGTVLESHSVHDYKTHTDLVTGKEYMVDGGKAYERRSANGDEEVLTVYSTDDHSKVREFFTWGTYGKRGTDTLTFKTLQSLSSDHIRAIIETQKQLPPSSIKIFNDELKWRDTHE